MNIDIVKYDSLYRDLLKGFDFACKDENLKALDLVTIMGSIYCEDIGRRVSGNKKRKFVFDIPLFEPELWRNSRKIIEDLANWVSDENYEIMLTKNNADPFEEPLLQTNNNYPTTLFSGGLDSLSGAYYNLKNSIKSDYIGFVNKNEEYTHQRVIGQFYRNVFSDDTKIQLVQKPNIRKEQLTQATRSLLYIALAVANSHFNESNEVYLYENGILSLNPELSGRFTTKTTHPKTIQKYNNLLSSIGFDIKIKHPFLFCTKGDIINNMNHDFKSQIKNTFTCGSGRNPMYNHKGQCGICVPCILRKISIASHDNEKFDGEYHYNYGIKFTDISEDYHRKKYESDFQYFVDYVDLINQENIHLELDIKKEYYQVDESYHKKNDQMFKKFSNEFERFLEKHAPY